MNKKGNFLIGILFAIFGIIILIGVSPAIEDLALDLKTNSTFNCEGSLGADALNPNTNFFGCTISSLILPILILGVIIASIMIIMYGDNSQTQQPYGYQ